MYAIHNTVMSNTHWGLYESLDTTSALTLMFFYTDTYKLFYAEQKQKFNYDGIL